MTVVVPQSAIARKIRIARRKSTELIHRVPEHSRCSVELKLKCRCGKVLRARLQAAGKRGKCSDCGFIFTIPAVPAEPASRVDSLQPVPSGDSQVNSAATPAPTFTPPAEVRSVEPTGFDEDDFRISPISTEPAAANFDSPATGRSDAVGGADFQRAKQFALERHERLTGRKRRYFALLLLFLPLAWSTLQTHEDRSTLGSRLAEDLKQAAT